MSRGQKGYTIIEVIMVLAITGFLFSIALFGQGSLTRRNRFTDSINKFHSSLIKTQEEVLDGVFSSSTGRLLPGSDTNKISFAKVIDFSSNQNTAFVFECYVDTTDGPTISRSPFSHDIECANISTLKIEWGAQVVLDSTLDRLDRPLSAEADTIVMMRHHSTGHLYTHAISSKANELAGNVPSPSGKSEEQQVENIVALLLHETVYGKSHWEADYSAIGYDGFDIRVRSPEGYQALIQINQKESESDPNELPQNVIRVKFL